MCVFRVHKIDSVDKLVSWLCIPQIAGFNPCKLPGVVGVNDIVNHMSMLLFVVFVVVLRFKQTCDARFGVHEIDSIDKAVCKAQVRTRQLSKELAPAQSPTCSVLSDVPMNMTACDPKTTLLGHQFLQG